MRFVLVVLAACAPISQDRATGPDGVIEGARELPLDRGRAETTGTISYPYGDRVDWFVIALPKDGAVEFDFEWFPKAQRDRAMFEIWNSSWQRIVKARSKREMQRVRVDASDIRGRKVYVRVYAPRRSDAGTYSVIARFYTAPEVSWLAEPIPEPPILPAVPDAPPQQPPPPRAPKFRVIQLHVEQAGLLVRFNAGWDHGMSMGWRARFVTLEGRPIDNGEIEITRVDKRVTTGRAKLTADQVHANPYVRVDPP